MQHRIEGLELRAATAEAEAEQLRKEVAALQVNCAAVHF